MAISLTRAVGRNTIIQFAGKMIGTVLGLITIGLIQRYLQPAGFGGYTTAMAYLGFFSVLADLGLYLILIRELAKPGTDESFVVGNLLALRWLSALIILSIGAGTVWFFPYATSLKIAVAIGTFSFIAVAATQLLVGIFQTKLAMGRVAAAELMGRIVLLGLTVVAITNHGRLQSLIVAVVGGSLINFFMVWLAARRYVDLKLRFDFSYWKTILLATAPIAISVVLNLIYFRADTIILSLFKGPYTVGLYGAAYKILEILNTFPIMFVGLVLPALGAAFAASQPERFKELFQRSFELLCMAIAPIIVGGWILAEPMLVAIGQSGFAPAAPVLRLLLFAVAALFFNSLSGHAITIINRQRQMVWGYLTVAAVGLSLYVILIPRFSLFGAAWGTIITESLSALIGYVLIFRVMKFKLRLGLIPKIIISAAVMGLALYPLRSFNFWLVSLVGGLAYGSMLILTRTLSTATIRTILSTRPDTIEDPLS